ncbi:MAG TPA: hemolysin family protein, partial [Myxococcota bacterium]|nr:hemolysin family protein [Myxococcota bacterium]
MESDLYYSIILILCLCLSAIFSLAETALTSVPETYIRKLIEEKRGFIKPFKLWLRRPNRVLTAIIVGNNLFNTLAAVVATIFAQRLFQHYVISIATGAVTIALLIFGEITPKTFARHNARAVLSWVVYLIYPVYFILFPAVWVLSHFAVWLVKLLGGNIAREGPVATEEDIAYLIRLSHEEGVFKPEQGEMLQSVISFRETCAREIMVPRTDLFTLSVDATLEEITSQVAQHGFTRWPVYSGDIDHVVGVFHVKDLISFQSNGGQHFVLKDHLRKVIFIPESMKLDAVLREIQRKKVHLAIVVDEYGGTAGIVTLEDILEEIVGEIRDEYDREEEEETIRRMGPDFFIADGRASISEVKRVCGIELPEDESYETLGGFLIFVLG